MHRTYLICLALCMVVTATVWNTYLAGRFEGVVPKEILDGKPLIERPRPDSRGGRPIV